MSKLEHLDIDSKGAKWLISNTGNYRFNSLKHLNLDLNDSWQSNNDETSLYSFLHTFPNLQILELRSSWGNDCNIREFVPSGNTAPKQRLGSVLLLKELTLWTDNMEDIGFERDPALQRSLHRLVLRSCYKLTRLAHSSVSFTHLTYLQVSHCYELKTLMTCSTAKSLVQLTTIKVSRCDKLNEIVSNDEGNDDKEIKIVFAKLITIQFEGLRNLTSFCSNENCEFSMPLLEKVILKGCPKMKTFTAKLITTPRLRSVLVSERYHDEEKRYWEGDLNRTLQMLVFADKVRLELSNQPELKQVWCDQTLEQVNRFQNLKSLVVKRCGYLVHVIPSHLLHCFKNLENLKVSDCDGVQIIFNMDADSSIKKTKAMAMSRLKTLSLENLPNLEYVWNTDPKGIIHFQVLQDLNVDRCDNLEYVFPSSMAKDLAMLNNLSIKNCEKVVQIFAEDKTIIELEDTAIMIVLDSLRSLHLMGVPLLKYFYSGQHKLKFPKLTTLNIEAYKWMILNCQEADAFMDQQIIVQLDQVNRLFNSLETLSFDMRGAMLTWKLKSHLLQFGYSSQERVEEVLFEEKPKAGYVEFLSHLKGLSLDSLYTLKSIGFENSWIHPILDIIQTLEVKWCDDIKNLVASKVSFSSLTKLDIRGCDDLLYLFTSSTAESLSQLKEMKISECKSMREIISKEDDESHESNESIIFEQLQVLHLEDLPMLRWFYSGKRTLCFPSLQQLTMIGEFWTMTTFCPHILINLDSVKLFLGRSYNAYTVQWEENIDATIRKMNDKKTEFEKKVTLTESQYFQEMWRGSLQVTESSFSNLESLVVHQCDFLSEVIPANLLPFLNNMQHLEVQKCRSVKTIFDVKCLTKDKILEQPIEFSLKKLVLENLPNLDTIWNEDPDGILHFQLVEEVRVDTCKSLTSLFPESVAKDLNKLENLELKHCESMVQTIPFPGIEATPQETTRDSIMFPCLTSLTLLDLPSFNCFYCSFHCVRLKTLNGHDDPQIENQVCFKEVTPKLFNLSLGEKEAKMIGHEECEKSHFYNINISDMQSFNVKIVSDELPYAFLQRVSRIKSLEVSNSSIKEIFCYERPNLDSVQFLSQLKELKLTSLSKLTSIGFEHSWIRESSILNLTHLTISKCDSMIYLFTSATAKSLIQLKQMTISDCKSMQWIVSNEGEASHGDQIVFKQLQELRFECLKSLRRFCNGGFTLSFPSLEKLEVFECDRMETFCESTINTSKLSAVSFSKYRDGTPLEDDLNSTIHNAYKTKVANFLREVDELKLSEHPRIHGIWNAPFGVPSHCFIKLKILIVEKCEFTSVVLPSHILSLLCQLEELVVRQCDSVKAIFEVTHEAQDTQINSLRSSLKKLTIEQLPNLEHLFPASVAENLIILEKLEVTNCVKLVEIIAMDEAAVEGAPKEFALKSMTSIKLWNLPELKCFYPASHKLECPKLEEVH